MASPLVIGKAEAQRVGIVGFPVWEIENEGVTMARLGRFSSWSIYFGRGQRIVTDEGERWRLGSTETGGEIFAVLFGSDRTRLAVGSVGKSVYGVDGKDFAFMLFPNGRDRLTTNDWTLSSTDAECAVVRRQPFGLTAHTPVPLPAAILSLALVRLGIPGERKLRLPSVQWAGG